MSTTPIPFPTIAATITIVLSPPVVQDINTHWISETVATAGTLAAAAGASDTTLTLNAPPLNLAAGSTVLIDSEPIKVTAINGATLTVERYAAAFPFMQLLPVPPQSTHAAGAPVRVLQWPDPWTVIAQEALRPWAQQVVIGLGPQSATFGSLASGSLVAGQA